MASRHLQRLRQASPDPSTPQAAEPDSESDSGAEAPAVNPFDFLEDDEQPEASEEAQEESVPDSSADRVSEPAAALQESKTGAQPTKPASAKRRAKKGRQKSSTPQRQVQEDTEDVDKILEELHLTPTRICSSCLSRIRTPDLQAWLTLGGAGSWEGQHVSTGAGHAGLLQAACQQAEPRA